MEAAEKKAQRRREYYLKNKERENRRNREWYQKNRGKVLERQKRLRAAPEKAKSNGP